MRVDKTDLDDSVVEDGEAATILISDGKTMTTKKRVMNGDSSHPANGIQMLNGCHGRQMGKIPQQTKNNRGGGGGEVVAVVEARKQREPVEDCEEEGEQRKEVGQEDILDSLTHSMKGVSIQETAASLEIEGKLAELRVSDKDEDEEDDTRCASLQSQTSVITVDPPSLPHDVEEAEGGGGVGAGEKGEGGGPAEDLASRGPTAGKPSSYRPNQDGFNRIAGKAYSSHNLDRFHPPLAASAGFQPTPAPFMNFDPSAFYRSTAAMSDVPAPSPSSSAMGMSGKRGMEEEEETPFKYTRPVEEMGYGLNGGGGGGAGGDLQQQSRDGRGGGGGAVAYFSQVSADLGCGGNVMDRSLSPEEELAQSIKPSCSGRVSYEHQMSFTDVDSILQSFSNFQQNMGSDRPRDHDGGYSSENSPHSGSDNAGSPGSSPKSVFSPPMRPPSILSQDSGIASPLSEDTMMSTVLPSPPEHGSSQQWVDSPGNNAMASYPSPPGGSTLYQSPPHTASGAMMSPSSVGSHYQSPPSVGQYHSPASVAQYHSPPSVGQYHSPPSVTQYHSPSSMAQYHSPPSVTQYHSPPSVGQYHSPPSVAQYHSPPSVASMGSGSAMSPYSVAGSGEGDLSCSSTTTTSAPSPPSSVPPHHHPHAHPQYRLTSPPLFLPEDYQNDYFFNTRREELKDALDVIAKDMITMGSDKKKPAAAAGQQLPTSQKVTTPSPAPAPTLAPAPAPATPSLPPPPPASSTLPISVSQQQQKPNGGGRPEKLPIAPLQKSGRGLAHSQPQVAPGMKGAVPVMVMPGPVPMVSHPQPSTTPTSTPVTSASVLLMNSGQNQMILLLNGNGQQPPAQTPKKKLPKILPRPGPSIAESATLNPALKPISPKAAAKGEVAPPAGSGGVTKQEPGSGGGGAEGGSCGGVGTVGGNGVRPTPPPVLVPAAQPGQGVSSAPAPTPSVVTTPRRGSGNTPSQSKMLNIARRLVASMTTIDLQFQDSEGDTYLHVSVCKADKNMVQALLERMSREDLHPMINTQNLMRQTPLYLAVSANSPEMAALLILYGADINLFAEHTRADGRSTEVKAALHCAASHGHGYLPTLQTLLGASELNIDLLNSEGHTALHCAILEHGKADSERGIINSLPIIQALIQHGADPNAQGKKNGKTPLMYALESRDLSLMEHMVALIDLARLRLFLKTQAFDGSTGQRILENLQRCLEPTSRQRLHACFRTATSKASTSSSNVSASATCSS